MEAGSAFDAVLGAGAMLSFELKKQVPGHS